MSESLVFFALISLLILVPSESNAYETCFENDISWTNTSSKTSIHPISSPEECQGLCFDRRNCSKWTLSLDKEICLLFSSDGNKIPFPGSVSGPRSCDISFSCEANGENIISAVSNVTSEENCQELCCQDYDKCKFYTWYETTSIMSNYCFLLSSCNNQNSDCPDCRSGPNCYSEFFVEKDPFVVYYGGQHERIFISARDILVPLCGSGKVILKLEERKPVWPSNSALLTVLLFE